MREKIIEIMESIIPGFDFNISNSLVDDGFLDSLGIMNLIAEVSMEFNVMLPFNELESKDFNSIDSIEQLIKKYKD